MQAGAASLERSDVAGIEDLRAIVSEERLHRLYRYLEAKRAGRPFAARRDLDPLEFPYVLGNVMLADVLQAPLRFRYRLVGVNLVNWHDYDLTGTLIDDHPDREFREIVLAAFRRTVENRMPTAGVYNAVLDGKSRSYQTLRVPLSDDGVTINMLLAATILAADGA